MITNNVLQDEDDVAYHVNRLPPQVRRTIHRSCAYWNISINELYLSRKDQARVQPARREVALALRHGHRLGWQAIADILDRSIATTRCMCGYDRRKPPRGFANVGSLKTITT